MHYFLLDIRKGSRKVVTLIYVLPFLSILCWNILHDSNCNEGSDCLFVSYMIHALFFISLELKICNYWNWLLNMLQLPHKLSIFWRVQMSSRNAWMNRVRIWMNPGEIVENQRLDSKMSQSGSNFSLLAQNWANKLKIEPKSSILSQKAQNWAKRGLIQTFWPKKTSISAQYWAIKTLILAF